MALKVNREKHTAQFLLKCQKEATKERKVRVREAEGDRWRETEAVLERETD